MSEWKDNVTVKVLHRILEYLMKQGYGDYYVNVTYDGMMYEGISGRYSFNHNRKEIIFDEEDFVSNVDDTMI